MFVLPGQMKLSGEEACDRVVVEVERVPQALEIAPHDAEARVDLLPSVVARIAEREEPVRMDLRAGAAHDAVGYADVRVFDEQVPAAGAPQRVPRAHRPAVEIAFDPRPPECAGHRPVELAVSADHD